MLHPYPLKSKHHTKTRLSGQSLIQLSTKRLKKGGQEKKKTSPSTINHMAPSGESRGQAS